MPIRDYRCDACDHNWEELRKDQSDPSECPICKQEKLTRVVSKSSGFVLKGDGWYKSGFSGGK